MQVDHEYAILRNQQQSAPWSRKGQQYRAFPNLQTAPGKLSITKYFLAQQFCCLEKSTSCPVKTASVAKIRKR